MSSRCEALTSMLRWQRALACAAFGLLLSAGAPASVPEAVFATDGADGSLLLSDAVRGPSSRVVVLVAAEASRSSPPDPRERARRHPAAVPDITAIVEGAARRHALDPALLHAVITIESGYAPRALSSRGAGGLMQLMPATAARYGVTNRFDPRQNVDAGAKHLRDLLDAFGQDPRLALAAYNAGVGAVRAHGGNIPPYRETMAYVPRVMQRWAELHDPTRRRPGEGL